MKEGCDEQGIGDGSTKHCSPDSNKQDQRGHHDGGDPTHNVDDGQGDIALAIETWDKACGVFICGPLYDDSLQM